MSLFILYQFYFINISEFILLILVKLLFSILLLVVVKIPYLILLLLILQVFNLL